MNYIDHLLLVSLWDNSLIRINNRPVFYKSWFNKGDEKVGHVMKDSNTLFFFSKFKERFQITTNFLAFHGLIAALKTLKE